MAPEILNFFAYVGMVATGLIFALGFAAFVGIIINAFEQ